MNVLKVETLSVQCVDGAESGFMNEAILIALKKVRSLWPEMTVDFQVICEGPGKFLLIVKAGEE